MRPYQRHAVGPERRGLQVLFQGALSAEMTPTVHAVLVATLHAISAGGKGPGKEDTSPAQSNKVVFARGAGGPRVSREALAVASGAQAHTVSCTHLHTHAAPHKQAGRQVGRQAGSLRYLLVRWGHRGAWVVWSQELAD